jgi:putative FmdB family regulatory protein
MPLYEYAPILNAGENSRPCCTFETLQNSSDEPLTQCPKCKHPIKRLISSFAVKHTEARHEVSSTSTVTNESQMPREALPTSNTAAGRALNLAAGHVCHAGCKHSK